MEVNVTDVQTGQTICLEVGADDTVLEVQRAIFTALVLDSTVAVYYFLRDRGSGVVLEEGEILRDTPVVNGGCIDVVRRTDPNVHSVYSLGEGEVPFALSPCGGYVALCTARQLVVRSATTGGLCWTADRHPRPKETTAAVFSNGSHIAFRTASWGTLRVCEAASGKSLYEVGRNAHAFAFSKCAKRFIYANPHVIILDANTGVMLSSLPKTDDVRHIATTERFLILSSENIVQARDLNPGWIDKVRVSLLGGARFVMGHAEEVLKVIAHREETLVVLTARNVRIWSLHNGNSVRSFPHKFGVCSPMADGWFISRAADTRCVQRFTQSAGPFLSTPSPLDRNMCFVFASQDGKTAYLHDLTQSRLVAVDLEAFMNGMEITVE